MTRTRTKDSPNISHGGYVTRNGAIASSPSIYRESRLSMTDEIASAYWDNWGDKPMSSDKQVMRCDAPLSGAQQRGSFLYEFKDHYPPLGVNGIFSPLLLPSTTDSSRVPGVFSRSNPSRSSFDTATFLGELRDFPGMAKSIWNKGIPIAKNLAKKMPIRDALNHGVREAVRESFNHIDNEYLENVFGWQPFVRDIGKYLDVSEAVQNRLRVLQRLKERGHSGGRVNIDSDTITVPPSTVSIWSYSFESIKALQTDSRIYNRWGTTRWYLGDGPLKQAKSHSDMVKLARKAVLGQVVDFSTSWNLMPWSWLLDWAGNIGDYVSSNRNVIGANHGTACIMTHAISIRQWKRTDSGSLDAFPQVSGGDCTFIRETKKRTVHGAGTLPELSLPILTGSQVTILGTLATTRAVKSR